MSHSHHHRSLSCWDTSLHDTTMSYAEESFLWCQSDELLELTWDDSLEGDGLFHTATILQRSEVSMKTFMDA